MHVAIIGSGPSGVFAAKELLDSVPGCKVDVIDRLPTPFGLVRYGVAPDHPKIKSVTASLAAVLSDERVSFVGNVEVGTDVSVEELKAAYDGVVVATGAPDARALGIPGEELTGSISAAELVAWYNGHPDRQTASALHGVRRAAVVGAGNVTLDVARILLKGGRGLASTDVPDDVIDTLEAVDVVHIVVRRSVTDVKFSYAELIELDHLEDVSIVVDPEATNLNREQQQQVASNRALERVVDIFRRWSEPSTSSAKQKVLRFWFNSTPVGISGHEVVTALSIRDNSHDERSLEVEAVIRSIGYRGRPLSGVPWDEERAIVPNSAGRVAEGTYVAGWAKRGPSGIIGTNKPCAAESIQSLVADLTPLVRDGSGAAEHAADSATRADRRRALRLACPTNVDWPGWLRIDAAERDRGHQTGRERAKIPRREDLLAAAADHLSNGENEA